MEMLQIRRKEKKTVRILSVMIALFILFVSSVVLLITSVFLVGVDMLFRNRNRRKQNG